MKFMAIDFLPLWHAVLLRFRLPDPGKIRLFPNRANGAAQSNALSFGDLNSAVMSLDSGMLRLSPLGGIGFRNHLL